MKIPLERSDVGMLSRRRFMYLMGGMALAYYLSGCIKLFDKPITVGAHVWPGYEPLFLARKEGWLDATKVRLLETSSASDSLRALSDGTLQGAALTLDEVLRARGNGIPLSVVMIFDISAGADILLVRSGTTKLSDLKGRRIGFEPGAVGELMLSEVLRAAGLTKEDARLIPLTIDKQRDAWIHNLMDACITFEPVAGQLMEQGAVNLFDSRQLPDTIFDVLAIRGDALDSQHADAIRHLILCHFKALDHLQHNPHDAAYRMASHLRLPVADVLPAFKGLVLPDVANNNRLLSGKTLKLLTTARKLSTLMVRGGSLKQEDRMDSLIHTEFLPTEFQVA